MHEWVNVCTVWAGRGERAARLQARRKSGVGRDDVGQDICAPKCALAHIWRKIRVSAKISWLTLTYASYVWSSRIIRIVLQAILRKYRYYTASLSYYALASIRSTDILSLSNPTRVKYYKITLFLYANVPV